MNELKLPNMNLYHRLLECYLYLHQNCKQSQPSGIKGLSIKGPEEKIEKEINALIERFESKVDKNYVLFLFQIYSYADGVQGCCEMLKLKQELLSYYI